MNIDCDIKPITNITTTKCLRAIIDIILCRKSHIDQIIPEVIAAGWAIIVVKPPVSQDTWKIVYYFYFHSIMIHNNILEECFI